MYRLFVVEDDRGIAESVKRYLDGFGYETVLAEDFGDVLGQFVREAPHLVILDISLPFFNGYYWCAEIRRLSKVPVLFLSSAGDNMNIVMAMDQGGDDFIPKPFDLNVLVSKVRALLRRAYEFQSQTALIEHRGAVLDLGSGVLHFRGNAAELTKNELKILQTLLENKGRVVSREELMKRLWESDSFVDDNTLTVNVARLRYKLKDLGLKDFIKTRRAEGYLAEEGPGC